VQKGGLSFFEAKQSVVEGNPFVEGNKKAAPKVLTI
jgi:hypothetical protein